MPAVLVGQPLGLLVVFGELHGGLTALGEQRPVGQERLLLPSRHVDALREPVLLQSKQSQSHGRPELSLPLLYDFKVPAERLTASQSKQPLLLGDFIFQYVIGCAPESNSNLTQYFPQVLQFGTEGKLGGGGALSPNRKTLF